MPDVGFETQAQLIVAAADLKLVRLLRQAMNPAATGPVAGIGPAPTAVCRGVVEPRIRIEPEPRIEPRQVHHPDPRIEPRPVIHPAPRVVDPPRAAPLEPEQPSRLSCPIQPPWKVRVWDMPLPPTPRIKLVVQQPDIVSKGSLIDLFI